jgi:hypothetical protein
MTCNEVMRNKVTCQLEFGLSYWLTVDSAMLIITGCLEIDIFQTDLEFGRDISSVSSIAFSIMDCIL